jgi:hypothetical protein
MKDGRVVYIGSFTSFMTTEKWPIQEQCFRVVLFIDEQEAPDPMDLFRFVTRACDAGATAFLCAGTAAERTHDICDETLVMCSIEHKISPRVLIPTTWHVGESMEDVLWQAANVIRGGAEKRRKRTPLVVLVSGNGSKVKAIEDALASQDGDAGDEAAQ